MAAFNINSGQCVPINRDTNISSYASIHAMFQGASNPIKIQSMPSKEHGNQPTPLVLVHDGSGTTFSYFILGDLHREVWAIHNPHHGSSVPLEGGINEMARHYIQLMQAAGISGPILLGGWSFGSYMSLAMARILAGNISSNITVAGLLIIDSAYHSPQGRITVNPSKFTRGKVPPFLTEYSPQSVRTSFEVCEFLLDNWELPKWDGPALRGEGFQVNIAGRSQVLEHGIVLHKPDAGSWTAIETATYSQPEYLGLSINPPPAVAIRCTQPTSGLQDEHCDDKLLGWEGTHPDFIKAVIDVDAEHYTMFDHCDQAKMDNLTTQFNEAMEILDSIQPAGDRHENQE